MDPSFQGTVGSNKKWSVTSLHRDNVSLTVYVILVKIVYQPKLPILIDAPVVYSRNAFVYKPDVQEGQWWRANNVLSHWSGPTLIY